jgi:peptide deformylase
VGDGVTAEGKEEPWWAWAIRPMAMVGRKHDALHRPAVDVVDMDEALELAARMFRTLVAHPGAGIAACQVGRPVNLIVTHDARVFANVHVTDLQGGVDVDREGCLSLPDRWFTVPRHLVAHVAAFDVVEEQSVGFTARGWDARMWQHESDHLAGLLLAGRFDEIRG